MFSIFVSPAQYMVEETAGNARVLSRGPSRMTAVLKQTASRRRSPTKCYLPSDPCVRRQCRVAGTTPVSRSRVARVRGWYLFVSYLIATGREDDPTSTDHSRSAVRKHWIFGIKTHFVLAPETCRLVVGSEISKQVAYQLLLFLRNDS